MDPNHPCQLAQAWLVSHAEEVVKHLLPNAKKRGKDYVIGSLSGEEGQSLHITVEGASIGRWRDFSTGDKGNISGLWRAVRQIPKDDYKTFFEQLEAF